MQPAISSRAARHSPLPLGFILPCLPTASDRCKSGPAWVHEIKHDGYRMIVRRTDDRVRLYPPRRMLVSDQPWGPPRGSRRSRNPKAHAALVSFQVNRCKKSGCEYHGAQKAGFDCASRSKTLPDDQSSNSWPPPPQHPICRRRALAQTLSFDQGESHRQTSIAID